MPVDAVARPDPGSGTPSPRTLTPLEVAPASSVEPQLRAAKADLASLGLQLAKASRIADAAEAQVPPGEPDDDALERGVRDAETRRAELDAELAARRTELDEELRREQAEADAKVAAAEAEGAALVATATAALEALLAGRRGDAPAGDPLLSDESAPAPLVEATPPVPVGSEPTGSGPVGDITTTVPEVAAPAVPAPGASKVAPDATDESATAASGAPAPTARPAPYLAYVVPAPGAARPSLLALPAHPHPVPVQIVMAPGWGAAQPSWDPAPPPPPAPRESFVSRLMHLDVILPLIALVIVLVVLGAWVL